MRVQVIASHVHRPEITSVEAPERIPSLAAHAEGTSAAVVGAWRTFWAWSPPHGWTRAPHWLRRRG